MGDSQTLCFEWQSQDGPVLYVLDAAALSGVGSGCPFGPFPGLPPGMLGLVLWNGKLVPVLDGEPTLGEGYRERMEDALARDRVVYVFAPAPESLKALLPGVTEVALGLPCQVKAFRGADPEEAGHQRIEKLEVIALAEAAQSEAA